MKAMMIMTRHPDDPLTRVIAPNVKKKPRYARLKVTHAVCFLDMNMLSPKVDAEQREVSLFSDMQGHRRCTLVCEHS